MRLLAIDGTETWGQLTLAVRNLRHTQSHVGDRSLLGRRIEDEIGELRLHALLIDRETAECDHDG